MTMPLAERIATDGLYSEHVNQQWVKLLRVLELSVNYERCEGAELFTVDSRRILDFLSGYCVHNVGHNHPHVVSAIVDAKVRRSYAAEPCSRTGRRIGAASLRARRRSTVKSFLCQLRQRRGRGRHKVFPFTHRANWFALCRPGFSRPDLWRALPHEW
jgi:hypothetical protein